MRYYKCTKCQKYGVRKSVTIQPFGIEVKTYRCRHCGHQPKIDLPEDYEDK
jgi:hypothetical protein